VNLLALRHELAAQHVVLSLSPAGRLKYDAPAPLPVELVEAMKIHRDELLASLDPLPREVSSPAADSDSDSYSKLSKRSPDLLLEIEKKGLDRDTNTPQAVSRLQALAQIPGHCGVCARWTAHQAPLEHLGICNAGRQAHGWLDGSGRQPVEIHAAHACAAWGGRGFQGSAERSGATRQAIEVQP